MSDIRGFLIDLDGVMYTGDTAISGAGAAIGFLEENGYCYRFISNTTRKCRRTIAGKLSRMGLDVPEQYIFTPPQAAVAYMKTRGIRTFRLLVTGDADQDFPHQDAGNGACRAELVIIGDAGEKITYASMNAAFRDLMGGADLIALERDRYWMDADGLSLSAGPFVSALEFAAGKTAILMGKPSAAFFDLALKDMGIQPAEAVMIGDDIRTDVRGAQDTGMRGVLVRTGKYREDLVRDSGIQPDLIIDSIADIGTAIASAGGIKICIPAEGHDRGFCHRSEQVK